MNYNEYMQKLFNCTEDQVEEAEQLKIEPNYSREAEIKKLETATKENNVKTMILFVRAVFTFNEIETFEKLKAWVNDQVGLKERITKLKTSAGLLNKDNPYRKEVWKIINSMDEGIKV